MSTPPVPPADSGVPPQGATPRVPRKAGAGQAGAKGDAEHDPTGIRALLSALPDPGPMPADLVARINASIAAEQSAREGGTVIPLRSRRWGWQHLGAAAAAAVVLAVGIPALLTGTGPGGVMTSLRGSSVAGASRAAASAEDNSAAAGSGASAVAPQAQPSTTGGLRVRGSVGQVALGSTGTAYTTSGLATQASTALGTALDTTAEAGKAAAGVAAAGEAGLRACLTAVGVESWIPVRGDVATLDGAPAVIALVGSGPTRTVYAVSPACDATHPAVLAGPLPLP